MDLEYNKTKYFLEEFERVAKKTAEQKIKSTYPECNRKENPWKIDNIVLIQLEKTEDEVRNVIVDYRCVYDIKEKQKGKRSLQTIYKEKELHFTVEETDLPETRYHQLLINYFYTLYKLDTTLTYPDVINKITGLKSGSYSYKGMYFALKYYYEFLNQNPTNEQDYSVCKDYYHIGLGHYLYGLEWDNYFKELFQNYFVYEDKTKVQKLAIEKRLAKDTLSLIKNYKYDFKSILIALNYCYKILEKPIPDTPTLGIVPYVMEDAQVKIVEEQERQLLLDYIYELFDLDKRATYPLIQAEIRKYHSLEYGKLTYKGMKSTLDYYYKIMGNPLPQVPNVGIIPYQYNNALAFYMQRKAVKDNGDLPDKVPVVRISVSREARLKSQQLYEDRYKWKPTKLISEIEVDEDETFDRL